MTTGGSYPVGAAGRPWEEQDRDAWRARQPRRRRYDDIVARIDALADRFDRITYGQLDYADDAYTLYALRSRSADPLLPMALITGGVHGYETSGILGALDFLDRHADGYAGRINLLVAPCVSPWGYERIHRWNYDAVDPNRNFCAGGPREAIALIDLVHSVADDYLVHVDLHETTDSDRTEFGPALCARDGTAFKSVDVPDGFYLVADCADPQLAFQKAIIAAVEVVTHIAPADARGEIIGSPIVTRGVIEYPSDKLALCTSITNAQFKTSTEVYPDSVQATPALCVRAQVTAVCAAMDFALTHAAAA